MKTQTVIIKHVNMLCHRCVINVMKALGQIQGIKELDIDLDKHYIRLKYINTKYNKDRIKKIVKEAIEGVDKLKSYKCILNQT